jgi:PAS domain S-box-containing protein
MNDLNSQELVKRYIIIGIIAGIALLIISYVFSFFFKDITISFSGIYELHRSNPVIWFIDLIPVLFAIAGYLSGKYVSEKIESASQTVTVEREKSNKVLGFVKRLIDGEFDVEYDLIDEHDVLGKSLVNLRDNLNENKKQEKIRRKEDEQRNWVAEGLAKFGEILRRDNQDMELLSYNIISNLVKYEKANQGAFFILHDNEEDNKYFEMSACFAYDRRKFADKKLLWGEGLIGAAALERQTIYLVDVPENYVNITSGLGKANPKCLLIVPLIVNEEIHGVIEIASFRKFEKHEVEFVEKVAESIASTISSVKINVRTARLLKESREQAETLASQEEQVRQNMEELQATQEEATRQAEKFISFTNSVNHTLIRAEYSTDGNLLYANTKFLNKLGYTANSEVEGKHISMFINEKDREWFDKIWDVLSKGGKHFEGYMKHVTKQGQDLWTMATYTCVRTEDYAVEKILFLAIDNTEQKKLSLDFEGQIQALNTSTMKAEFSPEGELLDCNERFLKLYQYQADEVKDKTVFDFFDYTELKQFKANWGEIVHKGKSFEGTYKASTRYSEEHWIKGTFSAVRNMYDEIAKIVCIATDTTNEKLMEHANALQTEQLKIQEEKLRQSGVDLTRQLERAKSEMRMQFREIEKNKLRHERTLEGAMDAIVTINHLGKIEFFNEAAELLWGKTKSEVIAQNVRILFSDQIIESDDFVARYVEPGENKIIGQRKEVKILNKNGEEKPVLFLLSEAKVDNEHTFTAFIQNIEVELF